VNAPAAAGATTDLIQPFRIEGGEVRGRLVRLSATTREILGRHAYPPPVAALLAESLALTAALAAALKFDGIFTFQLKGDGPVRLLVADVATGGKMRGYAQADAARVPERVSPSVPALLGKGHLALTVDQGPHTDRYQGIVDLQGETLADCARHYFERSEQIDTQFHVASAEADGGWGAAALMIQRMPPAGAVDLSWRDTVEDWRRARAIAATIALRELLDPALSPHILLHRLFNEDGVRVYRPHPLAFGCRCSRERAERVVRSIPPEERQDLKIDGRIVVTCEFCGTVYRFDDAALADGGVSPQFRHEAPAGQ
jgi:molecular chaperone Hsp33